MQPGDPLDKDFYVSTPAGAAATGLVTANFTFTAWHTPYGGTTATWSHGTVVSELGGGWYRARLTLPSTAGQWVFSIAHATNTVTPFGWEDELEVADLASIAAMIARPTVRVTGDGTIGDTVTLDDIVAWRKSVIQLSFVDGNGDPVHLASDYTNWSVGFSATDTQTGGAPRLDCVNTSPTGFGLVPDDSGLLTITIPDDLSGLFDGITEGAAPDADLVVLMEVTAEAPSNQTISMVAPSQLRILKRVVGSPAP